MITIKTFNQLYTEAKSNLESEWGESIPVFGKAFLNALALVKAGELKLFYLSIAKLQKNIFPDTADPEAGGGTLERFGRVKLGRNPFPAKAGKYTVQVSGDVGATIEHGTVFRSDDNSVNPAKLFILDNDVTLITGTDSILLRALEAGIDSRMQIGETMTLTVPIPLVSSGVTVTAETVEPQAAEDLEDYREKTVESFRTESEGGAGSDYRLWAFDAQGVENSYPYARSGDSNEIDLFVEATIADSTDGKGTPSGALLAAVEAVVEMDPDTTLDVLEMGRRPLGLFQVHYLPIVPLDIDIIIHDFAGLTADIQTMIHDSIKEATDATRPYIASVDVLTEKNDILSVNVIISKILEARPGSVFGQVELFVDGDPYLSYTFDDGNIPYLNNITYV